MLYWYKVEFNNKNIKYWLQPVLKFWYIATLLQLSDTQELRTISENLSLKKEEDQPASKAIYWFLK